MDSKNKENRIDTTGCLSMEKLTAYHIDQLSNEEAQRVEQHLIDCEMCSATVEMIGEHGADKVNKINERVTERVDARVPSSTYTNWRNIAAAIALIIGGWSIYYYMNSNVVDNAEIVRHEEIKDEEEAIKIIELEEVPKPVIKRKDEGLILQVAVIDSNEKVEYYDSIIDESFANEPTELAIVNRIDEAVEDSVQESSSITGANPIDVEERKEKKSRKSGYAYGAEGNIDAVAFFPGGDEELEKYLLNVAKKMTKLNGKHAKS